MKIKLYEILENRYYWMRTLTFLGYDSYIRVNGVPKEIIAFNETEITYKENPELYKRIPMSEIEYVEVFDEDAERLKESIAMHPKPYLKKQSDSAL